MAKKLVPIRSVSLPPGAEPPIRVYVNSEERREGEDFVIEGTTLRFLRPLRAQPHLGLGHKTLLAIGVGVYGDLRGDQLDIVYQADGQTRMTNVPLTPELAAEPPPG
jgi:hypothetical protein